MFYYTEMLFPGIHMRRHSAIKKKYHGNGYFVKTLKCNEMHDQGKHHIYMIDKFIVVTTTYIDPKFNNRK